MVEHIITFLIEWVVFVIGVMGYPGVLLLMAAESANIPIPSEAIMPFAGFLVAQGKLNFWVVVWMGVIGNWLGSSVSWWIGATGGRKLVDKYGKYVRLNHEHLDQAESWFKKYGEISVFVGRLLPIVRTFISLPAGLAKMNYLKFSVYTILGALPFCYALTWLGVRLGDNWESLRQYFHYLDGMVIVGFVIALVYYLLRIRSGRKKL